MAQLLCLHCRPHLPNSDKSKSVFLGPEGGEACKVTRYIHELWDEYGYPGFFSLTNIHKAYATWSQMYLGEKEQEEVAG